MHSKRRSLALLALLVALSLSGCGSPSQVQLQKGQAPSPVPTNQALVPSPVRTDVSGPVPSAIPTIFPTVGPPPTPDWNVKLYADSPEAQTIVERWRDTALAIRSIRGTQVFSSITQNGTQNPVLGDPYMSATGSDEWFDNLQSRDMSHMRYKVVFHNSRGDFTTLYDGTAAYRSWSWIDEVYRAWPDSSANNAFWGDDIDDTSMLLYIFPAGDRGNYGPSPNPSTTQYHLIGRTQLDGRNLIELSILKGNYGPNGMEGTHIFLDEGTYLPYRYVFYRPQAQPSETKPDLEVTFTRLETNAPLTNEDFNLKLTPGTPVIILPAGAGQPVALPKYKTLQEAQPQAGFALLEPRDGIQGEVLTSYFVELNGKRTPALTFNSVGWDVTESVYIRPDRPDLFARRFSDKLGDNQEKIENLEIDGQPAQWIVAENRQSLRLEKSGTQIEITGTKMKDQAIQIARGLTPIK